MNDLGIVDLIIQLYAGTGSWTKLVNVDGSYSALLHTDEADILVWRGSTTAVDWLEDFEHLALPVDDPVLGPVHPGFITGVRAVTSIWDAALATSKNLIICGHSLGAAHALLYAALAVRLPISRVVVFGSPRPGMARLDGILAPVSITSYRNRDPATEHHDLVTDVPFRIPPLLDYVEPRGFTSMTAIPKPDDAWGPLAFHHAELYREGLATIR